MKKLFYLLMIFLSILFSSCILMEIFGEELDIEDLNGANVSLEPCKKNSECRYEYKAEEEVSLVINYCLDFNKYDYYCFEAFFTRDTCGLEFIDEGKGLVMITDYNGADGKKRNGKIVKFCIQEKDFPAEERNGYHYYSIEKRIPFKASSPGNNCYEVRISTKKNQWCTVKGIKIVPSDNDGD